MLILTPVTLSEIFPNTTITNPFDGLRFRLQNFSRIETLRYCAHLNLIVSNPVNPLHNFIQQKQLVKMFFNDRAMGRIEKVAQEQQSKRSGFNLQVTVFSRSQLLEMIRWVCLYSPESGRYTDPTQNYRSRKMFAESLLLASDLAQNRIYKNLGASTGKINITPESSLGPLRQGSLEALKAMDLVRAFGRGKMMFFEHLPTECPSFINEFQATSELSLEEYFSCLIMSISPYFATTPQTAPKQVIDINAWGEQLPHMKSAFIKYLQLETQTVDEMRASLWPDEKIVEDVEYYNFTPLRQKPILRLSDNQAIVLDPVFHIEKATVGPLFLLTRQIPNLLSFFGYAFEKYAKNILSIMYPQSDQNLRLICDLKLTDLPGEPEISDACLVADKSLLLFEMKGKWIRDDKVLQPNYEEYLNELREKYGIAAGQLARAIVKLIDDEWTIPDHDIRNTEKIYPILLAYDTSLNVPGNTWFFASEFRNALEPDGFFADSNFIMTKKQWQVAPLTIMTIDDLENLEASIKNFNITDLLSDYFAFRDSNFDGNDDSLSLATFIDISDFSKKMDYKGVVASKSLEIFKESMSMILPEDLDTDSLD